LFEEVVVGVEREKKKAANMPGNAVTNNDHICFISKVNTKGRAIIPYL